MMSRYARCPTATGLQLALVCGQSLDNTRTRRYGAIPVGWRYTLTLDRTGCSVEATSFRERSRSRGVLRRNGRPGARAGCRLAARPRGRLSAPGEKDPMNSYFAAELVKIRRAELTAEASAPG